jgi:hypothetical protein
MLPKAWLRFSRSATRSGQGAERRLAQPARGGRRLKPEQLLGQHLERHWSPVGGGRERGREPRQIERTGSGKPTADASLEHGIRLGYGRAVVEMHEGDPSLAELRD